MNVFEIIFWSSLFFVVYTYLLYPLLIAALAKTKAVENSPLIQEWPTVGLIIPVHNEAHNLNKKLQNLSEIDYPREKLSITFVSDGSEDDTNTILKNTECVDLVEYFPRQGKPTAINRAMESQTAEIIVFTDARQTLDPGAVKKLVARLSLPNVGAVSGELIHFDSESNTAKDVGLYWRYEKWIRASESQFLSVPGVTGALYAIHRDDFRPIPEDTLLDDFEVPINILKQGRRILFEEGAHIIDSLQEDTEKEKVRKIRTLTGNFQSFSRNRWLFSPSKNPIWMQFLSHKVFRLIVPYSLISIFVSSMLLDHWFYLLAFTSQVVFYGLALLGRFSDKARKNRVISFINVFVELNLAATIALRNHFKNSVDVKWEKTS